MELTPQVVSEAEFREAKRGGYNIRDVDDFLDQVAVSIGQLQERVREAYHRAEIAEGRLAETQRQLDAARQSALRGPEVGTPPASPSETDETLRRTLVLAQRTADATVKEAKDEATRLLNEAREEAARTRASAEASALGDVEAARNAAQADVDHLVAQRDELSGEIGKLEDHLEVQRDNIRAGIDELQRLLDDPAVLRVDPAPPLTEVEPAQVDEGIPARAEDDRPNLAADGPSGELFQPPVVAEPPFGNGFRAGPAAEAPPTSPMPVMPSSEDQSPYGPVDFGTFAAAAADEEPETGTPGADTFAPEPERPPLVSRNGPGRDLAPPLDSLPTQEFHDPPEPRPPLEPRQPLEARGPLEPRSPLEPPRPPLESREPPEPRDPLPRRETPNLADIQEIPSVGGGPPGDASPSIFPSSLGAPGGGTGFLPDLPQAPDEPRQDSGLDASAFPGPGPDENLPLPLDAPPPPPPPPGLDHLRDAGTRPSEWGRGVFDDDIEDDESSGTRFGRPG